MATLFVQIAPNAFAVAGETLRVSMTSAGVQATGHCYAPKLSADGRYVAFHSAAPDLVGGDTNGADDVFRKDMVAGDTVRVSTDPSGGQAAGTSQSAAISSDGRYVAFESGAANLVAGDTNIATDVFRKDLVTGETLRVSTDSTGAQSNALSRGAAINSDGRYVLFRSGATNLVAGDTGVADDVFRKDLVTGETLRVSTDSSGNEANGLSTHQAISPDGRYVAFMSAATNLVAGDTNIATDIFRKDLTTGEILRCSTNAAGAQVLLGGFWPDVSWDGRFVAFASLAGDLVAGDTNLTQDIFRRELAAPAAFYFAEGTCRPGFDPYIT
ncbi:MAG: hypothetical protein CVU59_12115, partial [Deltaproteobacteria bacterium HGW-Deltaproteobacteria-17]